MNPGLSQAAPPRQPREPRSGGERLIQVVKNWLFFNLKIKHSLLILSVLFIASVGAILIYAIVLSQRQKIDVVVMELAGRQRMLIQKQTAEMLLATQGIPTDLAATRQTLNETLDALIQGGRIPAVPPEGGALRLNPAPTEFIRNKLNEERVLLKEFWNKTDAVLKLPRTDPQYPARLQELLSAGKILEISAGDSAKLFGEYSKSRIANVIYWETLIGIVIILLGLILSVQVRLDSRRLENEITERRKALWKLKQSEDLVRLAYTELERRVEARTVELSKANQDLETLLYVVSHDLKEPLRSIENFSSLILERYAGSLDEKGQKFFKHVIQGVERLHRLLDDILTLSRARRIGAQREKVDGESIVRESISRLTNKIAQSGAKIDVKWDFPVLQVEKTWAVEALFNLVSNALKFTRNGDPPDIEIAGYQSPHRESEVGFVVRDRGPGVSPEHAERIFQLFQRAVGREIEGTGAGLAIVKQIAERHGGRAWVQDRDGGGAEFYVTFSEPAAGEPA